MTNPDVKKCGVLSVYSGGKLRKKWKACYCRLYSNSLFHCFDGMVCAPKISIILNAVRRYILTGRETRRLDGRPKVRDSEERLLLAIPSRLDFPTEGMQWIKFLDDNSMRSWMRSIEETLDEGRLCKNDNEHSLSPEMRWSQSLPVRTSSEASDVSSSDMSHYPARHLHALSTSRGYGTGAAVLTAMAVMDRDRGKMHGRRSDTVLDSRQPVAQSVPEANRRRRVTLDNFDAGIATSTALPLLAGLPLGLAGEPLQAILFSEGDDNGTGLEQVSDDFSGMQEGSLRSGSSNDAAVQVGDELSSGHNSSGHGSRRTSSSATQTSKEQLTEDEMNGEDTYALDSHNTEEEHIIETAPMRLGWDNQDGEETMGTFGDNDEMVEMMRELEEASRLLNEDSGDAVGQDPFV